MTKPTKAATADPAEMKVPMDRIGFLIYRVGLLVAQAYETRMRPLGYSPVEVGVLTCLATGGSNHVRGIARALGVSPQTVVNVTLGLESRRLVRREKSVLDHRVTMIVLSQFGLDELCKVDLVAQEFDVKIAQNMSATQVASIIRGLKRLLDTGLS